MNEKKVILIAIMVLFIGFVAYNLGFNVTGYPVINKLSKIYLNDDKVDEGGTITVTVIPSINGVVNEEIHLTTPVYIYLYRVSAIGEGERTGYRLKVCDENRCTEKVTKIFRIPSDIILEKTVKSQEFYFSGTDGNGKEFKSYFTVINKDKVVFDIHN